MDFFFAMMMLIAIPIVIVLALLSTTGGGMGKKPPGQSPGLDESACDLDELGPYARQELENMRLGKVVDEFTPIPIPQPTAPANRPREVNSPAKTDGKVKAPSARPESSAGLVSGFRKVWADTKNIGRAIDTINRARDAAWAVFWPFLSKAGAQLKNDAANYSEMFFFNFTVGYFGLVNHFKGMPMPEEKKFQKWLFNETKRVGATRGWASTNIAEIYNNIDKLSDISDYCLTSLVQSFEFQHLFHINIDDVQSANIDDAIKTVSPGLAKIILKQESESPYLSEMATVLSTAAYAGAVIISNPK